MMTHLTRNRVATSRRTLALGFVLAALLAAFLLIAAKPAHASTTFTINSTEDHADANLAVDACDTGYTVAGAGGAPVAECTLRAALNQANYTLGYDIVNFSIPGSGVNTISPDSALPTVTGPVTINGYSQPGAKPNTLAAGNDAVLKIELSGAGYPGAGSGLQIEAANSTVKGLVVNRWFGGGININGSFATGNRVTGNYLGTDASGTQDLGNAGLGVSVRDAPNNTVGGTTAGERNVISGNNSSGVEILGATATGNRVTGNYLGTDASGTQDLGNTYYGVSVWGALNNTVGGTTAGERNVISGNNLGGVNLAAPSNSAAGNKVMGNYVGTARNGATALGNSGNGVTLTGTLNNSVGGTEAGARNVISANNGDGVQILGNDNASGNRVLSNSIFSNGDLGIDLVDDGVTPNDPADKDIIGANDLQNFPVLTSAKTVSGTTTLTGTLNSIPDTSFTLQFFANPSGDEGRKVIGQKVVSTGGSGNASFTFSPTQAVSVGQTITATATDNVMGNTSEFSAARKVVAQ